MAEVPVGARQDQRHLGRLATIDAAPAVHHTSSDARQPGCTLGRVGGVLRLVVTLVSTTPRASARSTAHEARRHSCTQERGMPAVLADSAGIDSGDGTPGVRLMQVSPGRSRTRSSTGRAAARQAGHVASSGSVVMFDQAIDAPQSARVGRALCRCRCVGERQSTGCGVTGVPTPRLRRGRPSRTRPCTSGTDTHHPRRVPSERRRATGCSTSSDRRDGPGIRARKRRS